MLQISRFIDAQGDITTEGIAVVYGVVLISAWMCWMCRKCNY